MEALDEGFSREVLKVLDEVSERAEEILKLARLHPITSKDFVRLTYGSFRSFRKAMMKFLKYGIQDQRLYKVMAMHPFLEVAYGVHILIPHIRVKKRQDYYLWEDFNFLHMVGAYTDDDLDKWTWLWIDGKIDYAAVGDKDIPPKHVS